MIATVPVSLSLLNFFWAEFSRPKINLN
jgi:hypothetical protein